MTPMSPWILISISILASGEPLVVWSEHPAIANNLALCEDAVRIYRRDNPTKFAYCERKDKAPPETETCFKNPKRCGRIESQRS
jgi:hypothetical protein